MYEANRHIHDEPVRMASGIKELRQRLRREFPGVLKSNKTVLSCGLSVAKLWMRAHPSWPEDIKVKKHEPDLIIAPNNSACSL